ncbi:hypothetical protein GQ44DRAFT_733557 [Phaeosphaeriaceae sp. PMI808]|nr:hypothetical protein GQ44DRAFT_733557 [Phaeosphaeriaceae sp. PMI808]
MQDRHADRYLGWRQGAQLGPRKHGSVTTVICLRGRLRVSRTEYGPTSAPLGNTTLRPYAGNTCFQTCANGYVPCGEYFVTSIIHYYYALPHRRNAALRIESARDLSPLYEASSEEDDEYGNPTFLYSSFGFTSDEPTAYFGRSKLKGIKESLELLLDEDVYPKAPCNIATSIIPIDSKVFLKGPKLHTLFIGAGLLPKLILQEADPEATA